MPIINVMEKLVDQKLEEILPTVKCCTCEKCLDDIRAMTLNKLPAKYVSTDKGRLFSKLNSIKESQNIVDINVAIMAAIEFVSGHPRHDPNESDENVKQEADEKKAKIEEEQQ